MSGWSEGDVRVGAARLHYYRRGSGRPLVLAHGLADSGECWTRIAEALEDAFDVIAYDARFHGKSDAPDDIGGDGASDLAGLADALELERPLVIGHSMGAGSAATVLADRPERFARAILEDGGLGLPMAEEAAGTIASAFRAWLEGLAALTEEQLIEQGRAMSPTWHPDEFGAWARSKLAFRPPSDFASLLNSGRPRTVDETASKWSCPVLALAGEPARGSIVTDEAIDAAGKACATFEAVRLAAGHNVRREAFDEFVGRVRAFLLET